MNTNPLAPCLAHPMCAVVRLIGTANSSNSFVSQEADTLGSFLFSSRSLENTNLEASDGPKEIQAS